MVEVTQAEITAFLDALENVSSHGFRLTRLVDGEETYLARCGEYETEIVGDTDDVYDWIAKRKREQRECLVRDFLSRQCTASVTEGASPSLIGPARARRPKTYYESMVSALMGRKWTKAEANELKHLIDIGAACAGGCLQEQSR